MSYNKHNYYSAQIPEYSQLSYNKVINKYRDYCSKSDCGSKSDYGSTSDYGSKSDCCNCSKNNKIMCQNVLTCVPITNINTFFKNIIYVPIININNQINEYTLSFDVDNIENNILQVRIIEVSTGSIVGTLTSSKNGFNYSKINIRDNKSHRLSVEVKCNDNTSPDIDNTSPVIYSIVLLVDQFIN